MAVALTAWLTAPAPIAWTSARLCSRTTPAMAPATADVRDSAETLIMSIGHAPLRSAQSPEWLCCGNLTGFEVGNQAWLLPQADSLPRVAGSSDLVPAEPEASTGWP